MSENSRRSDSSGPSNSASSKSTRRNGASSGQGNREFSPPPIPSLPPTRRSHSDGRRKSKSLATQESSSIPVGLIIGMGICLVGVIGTLIAALVTKPTDKQETVASTSAKARQPLDEIVPEDLSLPNPFDAPPNPFDQPISRTPNEPTQESETDVAEPVNVPQGTEVAAVESAKVPDQESEGDRPEPDKPSNQDGEDETGKEEVADVGDSQSDSDLTIDELIANGVALIRNNQRKQAIVSLKRASNLAPKEPRADFYLGLVYLGSGSQEPKDAKEKIVSAESHFNKAFNRTVDRTPERVAAANNLAIVEVKLRKFGAARNYFGIAAKQAAAPRDINHNIVRLKGLAQTFEIKSDEMKKINGLNADASDHLPKTGWIFLPLDNAPKTRDDCESLVPTGDLHDRTCSTCNGCTKLLCKRCGGRGRIPVMGTVTEKRDIGFGVVAGYSSLTTNFVDCPQCNTQGRVDCNACRDGRDSGL